MSYISVDIFLMMMMRRCVTEVGRLFLLLDSFGFSFTLKLFFFTVSYFVEFKFKFFILIQFIEIRIPLQR